MMRQTETGEVKGMVIIYRAKVGGQDVGDWRTHMPVVDYERCTACMLCTMYCPEAAIAANEEGKPELDFRFCKGCGVCANECPAKAIEMVKEG